MNHHHDAATGGLPPALTRRLVLGGLAAAPLVEVLVSPTARSVVGWSRALVRGSSGADVAELQVRLAGWGTTRGRAAALAADGVFGPRTHDAARRYQQASGLVRDGVVASRTQGSLDALVRSDGATAHFAFEQFAPEHGFRDGTVPADQARENVRRLMHRLEALRRKCGDEPVSVLAGFRPAGIGRASVPAHRVPSRGHTDGTAVDIAVGDLATLAVHEVARSCGFTTLGAPTRAWLHCDSGPVAAAPG